MAEISEKVSKFAGDISENPKKGLHNDGNERLEAVLKYSEYRYRKGQVEDYKAWPGVWAAIHHNERA